MARAILAGRSCAPNTPWPGTSGWPYNATNNRPGNNTRPPPTNCVPAPDPVGRDDEDNDEEGVPDDNVRCEDVHGVVAGVDNDVGAATDDGAAGSDTDGDVPNEFAPEGAGGITVAAEVSRLDSAEVDGAPDIDVLDAVNGGGDGDDAVPVPPVQPATSPRTAAPNTPTKRRVTRPPHPAGSDHRPTPRTRPPFIESVMPRIISARARAARLPQPRRG